jgi:pimeloyl-ACP methyl ester carboxylesterase
MVPENPRTSGSLVVDDVRLEFKTWPGSGVPILLLHEGLGSVSMWRDFPPQLALATGRSVSAWSRRGHGLSDPLPGRRNPDYMHREANAVLQLMDVLAIDRAVLFGHSDGASIALITAARSPDRVAALVLEAPHVFVEDIAIASIARTKQLYTTTANFSQLLGRYHRDPDQVFWGWNDIWLDPRFRTWSIEELLPAIRAPALLIQGRDDEYGTMAQLDRIGAGLANVERLELDRCGHSPHRDQPEAVLRATAPFLQRTESEMP